MNYRISVDLLEIDGDGVEQGHVYRTTARIQDSAHAQALLARIRDIIETDRALNGP